MNDINCPLYIFMYTNGLKTFDIHGSCCRHVSEGSEMLSSECLLSVMCGQVIRA